MRIAISEKRNVTTGERKRRDRKTLERKRIKNDIAEINVNQDTSGVARSKLDIRLMNDGEFAKLLNNY